MKNRLMKLVAYLMLAVFLAGITLSPVHAEEYTAETMRLLHYEGSVQIQSPSGESRFVMENARFSSGEAICTGTQSLASISLDSTKIVTMDEETRVEFIQQAKYLKLTLTSGTLVMDVQQKLAEDETLEVQTNTMTVGIRGTLYFLSDLPVESDKPFGERVTTLGVLEGHVRILYLDLQGKQCTLELYAGNKAELRYTIQDGQIVLTDELKVSNPGLSLNVLKDELKISILNLIDLTSSLADQFVSSDQKPETGVDLTMQGMETDVNAVRFRFPDPGELNANQRDVSLLKPLTTTSRTSGSGNSGSSSNGDGTSVPPTEPAAENPTADVRSPQTPDSIVPQSPDDETDDKPGRVKEAAVCALRGHHQLDEWVQTQPASCTATGIETSTCLLCGAPQTRVIAKTEHIPVKDAAVEATCTQSGLTEGSHCGVCNTVLTAQTRVDALGHSWGGWTQTQAASCTAAGSETSTCSRCGTTQTREIAKTAHTPVTDDAVEATCTQSGLTEGSHCSVCSTVLTAQTTVAPLGHTGGTATCQEQAVCSRCGASYGELGDHQFVEVEPGKAASCTDNGMTPFYRCSVCGLEQGGDEIAPLGHNFVAAICTRCGAEEGIAP